MLAIELDEKTVTEALLASAPDEFWADFEEATRCNCHSASLALVRSGLLGPTGPGGARVARGTLLGVGGQHSWAVIGDPFDPLATVVDITAWSYDVERAGAPVPHVWVTTAAAAGHRPHGSGSIWQWGVPSCGDGPDELLPLRDLLTTEARSFVEMTASVHSRSWLDREGWLSLCNAPVGGWPAAEILGHVADTVFASFVPIDPLGMLTDRNPEGLYW